MNDIPRDSDRIHQMPLNLQLRDDATLKSFYVTDHNREAVHSLALTAQGAGESFLYLWGPGDVGKTHLLQAACHAASAIGIPSVYIPLSNENPLSWCRLQGIENIPLVCMDDVDQFTGKPFQEEALFHLFNRIQLQNSRLLAAAHVPPKQMNTLLSDLTSRFTSGVTYQLHALTDDEKISALQLRAMQRGLQLTQVVGKFLLTRCPRNMSELFNALDKLDRASLTEQRRLTIPFVKQVLSV